MKNRKKQKLEKGAYGYLKNKKKDALIHTLLMAGIGIAIFIVGLLLNKMEVANIFTVFAFLMVLPAAKAFVTVIVLFPYSSISQEKKNSLEQYAREQDVILYDVVFTLAEKVMHLDCIYITEHQVIGYTSRKKDNLKVIQEYLKKELNSRCLDFVVYLATEEKQIKDRMKLRGEASEKINKKATEEVVEMIQLFTI